MRPLIVHGDLMDEISLYMGGEKAKISGQPAKATMLKRDRLGEILLSHSNNILVHASKHMVIFFGCLTTPPPPPRPRLLSGETSVGLHRYRLYQRCPVSSVNIHRKKHLHKVLAKLPRASNLMLGKWTLSIENPMPRWETVLTACLWADEESVDLRISLAQSVKEPDVASSDGERATTISLNKPHDGADGHTAMVETIPVISGKAILYAFALNEYNSCVCNGHPNAPENAMLSNLRAAVPICHK